MLDQTKIPFAVVSGAGSIKVLKFVGNLIEEISFSVRRKTYRICKSIIPVT